MNHESRGLRSEVGSRTSAPPSGCVKVDQGTSDGRRRTEDIRLPASDFAVCATSSEISAKGPLASGARSIAPQFPPKFERSDAPRSVVRPPASGLRLSGLWLPLSGFLCAKPFQPMRGRGHPFCTQFLHSAFCLLHWHCGENGDRRDACPTCDVASTLGRGGGTFRACLN